MKLLAHFHGYPPVHNAGAEHAAHGVFAWLAARGHQVTVYAARFGEPGTLDGVRVVTDPAGLPALYREHDMVITHLDETSRCLALARAERLPVIHYAHNEVQLKFHRVTPRDCGLLLLCAGWMDARYREYSPRLVMHPPIGADRYRVEATGDAITLINLTKAKGSETFYQLAQRLPKRRFIGVRGSYGTQDIRELPNVTILPNTPDIREVYRQTHILLMPSSTESLGRVAIEGAASGIPCLYHPTPGLLEGIGDGGIAIDRNDIDGWFAAIRKLSRKATYALASNAARARFDDYAVGVEQQLAALETALLALPADYRRRVEKDGVTRYRALFNLVYNGVIKAGEPVFADDVPEDRIRLWLSIGAIQRED